MTTPKRIQLRRTKGWRKPEGAIVVTRGTDWGNPFRIGDTAIVEVPNPFRSGASTDVWHAPILITRTVAVLLFRAWVTDRPSLHAQIRGELGGHDLACWCPLDLPCHADVLLEIANAS